MFRRVSKGQFWRDTVNRDLLKVIDVQETPITRREFVDEDRARLAWGAAADLFGEKREVEYIIPYVRALCIANNQYFGVQEFKVETLLDSRVGGADPRPHPRTYGISPRIWRMWGKYRFKRVFWLAPWYRWKFRKAGMVPKRDYERDIPTSGRAPNAADPAKQ